MKNKQEAPEWIQELRVAIVIVLTMIMMFVVGLFGEFIAIELKRISPHNYIWIITSLCIMFLTVIYLIAPKKPTL